MRDFIIVWVVAISVVLSFCGLGYLSFSVYRFYAPRYAQVDREVFEQSQSYNEGMLRQLDTLKETYESSNDENKAMLRATIIHQFSVYKGQLPFSLAKFYDQLRVSQ